METALGVTPPSPPATADNDVESVVPETSRIDLMAVEGFLASSHAPSKSFAGILQNHRISSTISSLRKECHLNTSTKRTTASVKGESMLHVTETIESPHQSLKVLDAQKVLLEVIKKGFCVYSKNFWNSCKTR